MTEPVHQESAFNGGRRTASNAMAARRLLPAAALASLGPVLAAATSLEPAPARPHRPADTVVATLAARIGEITGSPEYLFGDITSVVADRHGRIYVADRIGSLIRVYDSTGVHLRTIGREGDGPGEYDWPADLTFDPDGRLFVRDANRITVLAGAAGAIPDSVVRTLRIPGYANLSSTRSRSDGALYYYPAYLFRRDALARYFYLVFDTTGVTGDTLAVPPLPTLGANRSAFYMVSRGSGRMVDGLSRAPFEAKASWDVTSRGTVIANDGLGVQVAEIAASGDTVRAYRLPSGRRPVPADERADSARALEARLDSIPVPLGEVIGLSPMIRNGTWPDSLPASTSVHVAPDDDVWVGRWPDPDRSPHELYDVFGPGGYERTVLVPAALLDEPPPYVSDRLVVGVAMDPATEVQYVVAFHVPK